MEPRVTLLATLRRARLRFWLALADRAEARDLPRWLWLWLICRAAAATDW